MCTEEFGEVWLVVASAMKETDERTGLKEEKNGNGGMLFNVLIRWDRPEMAGAKINLFKAPCCRHESPFPSESYFVRETNEFLEFGN